MDYFSAFVICLFIYLPIEATNRYYNSYLSFGSGDTMIQPFHSHGGSVLPQHKWNIECLDGEAMVGIADWINDFIRIENVWCKFTFPNKPPTEGLYPYYPVCHVLNFTVVFNCYQPANHTLTSNTFVTGLYSTNLYFWLHQIPQDNVTLFKCCKTPLGYYIDYISCYYVPTHDMYFEYYDNPNNQIVYCAQGYVMTGISKKINPWTTEFRVDWIQCCRVGIGRPVAHAPPVTYMPSGVPAYSSTARVLQPLEVSPAYRSQYRSNLDEALSEGSSAGSNGTRNGMKSAHFGDTKTPSNFRPDLDHLLMLEARDRQARPNLDNNKFLTNQKKLSERRRAKRRA